MRRNNISEKAEKAARSCLHCGEVARSFESAEHEGWWLVNVDRAGGLDDDGLVCAAAKCRSWAIAKGARPAADGAP